MAAWRLWALRFSVDSSARLVASSLESGRPGGLAGRRLCQPTNVTNAVLVAVHDKEAVSGGRLPDQRLGAAELRLVRVDVAHLGQRRPVARLLHLGQLPGVALGPDRPGAGPELAGRSLGIR